MKTTIVHSWLIMTRGKPFLLLKLEEGSDTLNFKLEMSVTNKAIPLIGTLSLRSIGGSRRHTPASFVRCTLEAIIRENVSISYDYTLTNEPTL